MKTGHSNTRLSLDRERMRFVYKVLSGYDTTLADKRKTALRQQLRGLPVDLRTNGLATMVASLSAAKDQLIGEKILASWLLGRCPALPDGAGTTGKVNNRALVRRCMECSRLEYLALQQEAVCVMEQAKLLSEALWP